MSDDPGSAPAGNPGDGSAAPEIDMGAAFTQFTTGLPEDIRTEPSFQRIKDFDGLAKSYVNAQKTIGKDPDSLLEIPDWDDAEAAEKLFNKLGRPEAADGYERFGIGEDVQVDDGLIAWAPKAFHEVGLTKRQADALVGKWQEFATERAEKVKEEAGIKAQADMADLEKKWGKAYDAKIAAGQKAARKFGDPEIIDKLEGAMGTAGVLEMMANIGEALAEDSADGDPPADPFVLTPDAAKAKINEMMADPETLKALESKLHPGHAAAMDKKKKLHELAYGTDRVT